MTTQGSSEDPSSSARGAASGEDGSSPGSGEAPGEGFIPSDGTAVGGVAFAYRGEEVPPPPQSAVGRYRFEAPRLDHPPDPIMPFIAPPVPRKRRRDWPVLVFAIVIALLALATCCIAGFALYSSRAPFAQ
jgi:hypothetical protein